MHTPTEPPSAAALEERHCGDCARTTVWYQLWISPTGPPPGRFEWICSGQTRAELMPDEVMMDEALVLTFVGSRRRRSLVQVAATADALNRDYLSDPHFRLAVDRLAARELLSVEDDRLRATRAGASLLRSTKSRWWYDQTREICRRLEMIPLGDMRSGLVREGAYDQAIQRYLDRPKGLFAWFRPR